MTNYRALLQPDHITIHSNLNSMARGGCTQQNVRRGSSMDGKKFQTWALFCPSLSRAPSTCRRCPQTASGPRLPTASKK